MRHRRKFDADSLYRVKGILLSNPFLVPTFQLQQDSSAVIDPALSTMRSPRTPSHILMSERPSGINADTRRSIVLRRPPKFVVLDCTQLSHLDASAARGCFLQLVRMCVKRGITVCAAGVTPKIDWMLRSHDVSYESHEEDIIKALYQSRSDQTDGSMTRSERILLFLTIHEALEFCENALIHQLASRTPNNTGPFGGFYPLETAEEEVHSITTIFKRILGSTGEDERILHLLDGQRYNTQITLQAGEQLFAKDTHSDCFYTVLKGSVAVALDPNDRRLLKHEHSRKVVSGAGRVPRKSGSSSNLLDPSVQGGVSKAPVVVASMWPIGSIFGYVDFLLERPRNFRTVGAQDDTIIAKMTISQLHLLQNEEPALDALVQRALLQASILDLANCTCDE